MIPGPSPSRPLDHDGQFPEQVWMTPIPVEAKRWKVKRRDLHGLDRALLEMVILDY